MKFIGRQHHGGVVFGKVLNKPHPLANAIVRFMIVTLFRWPTLLSKILPVQELNRKFIFEQIHLILNAIENADGNIVAIIFNVNRVN